MSKGKVKIEQTLETKQVVKHLSDLARSLDAGVIRAEGTEDSVVLHVPEVVEFEMKVSRKKEKAKCTLELSWKDDGTRDEVFKIKDE